MNLWIFLALVCVMVFCEQTQPKDLCYLGKRSYTRSIQIPVKICDQQNTFRKKNGEKTVLNRVKSITRLNPGAKELRQARVVSTSPGGSVTAEQFVEMFPGMFFNKTKDELQPKLLRKITGPTAQHDGDLHCPTYTDIEEAPGKLMNIRKEMKEIVHFSSEGIYQYVQKGKCGPSSTQSCTSGGCYQVKSNVFLVVWQLNKEWPMTVDTFEVESYCSCKGITS